MMTDRKFCKPKGELKPIAFGFGACIASNHITLAGYKVGFMYREEPSESVKADSGWRFFSGLESEKYVDDPDNFCYYDVNTIANYDSNIIEYLESPTGSSFCRNESGKFLVEAFPGDIDP